MGYDEISPRSWGLQMIKEFVLQWPVLRQNFPWRRRNWPRSHESADARTSPQERRRPGCTFCCPYCAVGCGQLIFHKDGKLVSIEGDPESPISRGRLCPKGSDSYELLTHSKRVTKVKYRRPFAKNWEDLDLDKAMEMIADRLWESRERSFVESQDGQSLMQTKTIAHLGGATLDNEENYLIKKLFTGGLGMVCISNQARI